MPDEVSVLYCLEMHHRSINSPTLIVRTRMIRLLVMQCSALRANSYIASVSKSAQTLSFLSLGCRTRSPHPLLPTIERSAVRLNSCYLSKCHRTSNPSLMVSPDAGFALHAGSAFAIVRQVGILFVSETREPTNAASGVLSGMNLHMQFNNCRVGRRVLHSSNA
jgi:hypothetical protein